MIRFDLANGMGQIHIYGSSYDLAYPVSFSGELDHVIEYLLRFPMPGGLPVLWAGERSGKKTLIGVARWIELGLHEMGLKFVVKGRFTKSKKWRLPKGAVS